MMIMDGRETLNQPVSHTASSADLPAKGQSLEARFGGQRALTIDDYSRFYRVGRTKTYDLINSGTLKSVLIGGRRLIPVDAAEALLKTGTP